MKNELVKNYSLEEQEIQAKEELSKIIEIANKENDTYTLFPESFKEKVEKIKEVEKMLIYTDLKKFAEEHNTEKIDWNNAEQRKYYINYRYVEDKLIAPYTENFKSIGQIYFTSYEIAERAIKEFGEKNIKKLFK